MIKKNTTVSKQKENYIKGKKHYGNVGTTTSYGFKYV